MARFVAKFRKRVISDTGHEATITQRSLDVDAPDRHGARELAIGDFCALERVTDWRMHADDLIVEEADFPS
jgi:hypothetical protein